MDVSIIIPTKNEESNIGFCLKSIYNNAYPLERYEVIVVDNGSNDSTVSIAESCGATVYRKPGVNISALRNYGAEMAKGEVLAFIDADCTVAKDWLRQAARYFQTYDVSCFGSPPGIPGNPSWVQETWFLVRRKNKEVMETAWLESMNMFVRKEFFRKVGGFNEALVTCEDVDISYRLSDYGKIISDSRIKAIHHGEAKTLGEFFRKEKWRGKNNYTGVAKHGLKIHELPSIVLPIYYGLLPLIAVISLLVTGQCIYVGGVMLIWQFPILIIAFLKVRNGFSPAAYLRLLLLYNVYYLARLSAIF